jgi:hypothetical protein
MFGDGTTNGIAQQKDTEMTITTTLGLITFTVKKNKDTTAEWIRFAETMVANKCDADWVKAEYATAVNDHESQFDTPFPMTFPNFRDAYVKNAEFIVSTLGRNEHGIVITGQTMEVLTEMHDDGTVSSWNMQTIRQGLKKVTEAVAPLNNDSDDSDDSDAGDDSDAPTKSQLDVALATLPHLSVDELHLLMMAVDAACDTKVAAGTKVAA